MTARLANPSRQMQRVSDLGVWCPKCRQWRDRADFRANTARSSGLDGWCRPCKAAQDRERQARLKAARPPQPPAPPKPKRRFIVADGDGIRRDLSIHHGERRLAQPWPADDPAACVHPGTPVYAEDALTFLRECVAAEVCMGIVRGYVASVGQEATGLVVPKFVRIESAKLWNAVMKHRTGRRG